ncbi:hypothetical protein HZA40_04975, partial [Candidatus Peregrinibacteria bacterium]|nr:hypothetical protein [Candidatus Peregrinibacteria bacterium]
FEKFAYPDDKVEKASKEAININKNTQFVTYVLKFTAGSEKLNEVSIADQSMQNGIIWKDKEKDHNFQKSGYLNFNSIKSIQYAVNEGQNAQSLSKCTTSQTDACIGTDPGNIDNNFKNKDYISFKNLKANSVTYITYTMWYKNGVYLNQRCRDKLKAKDGGCGEQFENSAKYRIGNNSPVFSNKVKVIAICPYVLTRQGGDTFFHDVINTGIDVSQCFEVKNCEGPCITPETPGEQKNVNTGQGDYAGPLLLKSPSHDVCSASNNDSNGIKAYQNVLENFSSSICELRTDVAKAWTKQNITDAINANVKRLSRFEANLNDIGQISSTSQLPQDQSGVFVKTNGDLTIDNDIQDYAIGNSIDGLPAAQTYIVIGHDLIIKSNIVYDNSTNFIQTFNKKSIASAAFIVIGGNIEIDNSVDHIDGILMAVDKQGVGGGEVRSTEDKTTDEKPLNINGNLIGNVINLFTNRQYAGDPLQDDGSINIHYDERILLNPPPGINELINLQQVVVPN